MPYGYIRQGHHAAQNMRAIGSFLDDRRIVCVCTSSNNDR